ncbi:hypothetical protein [Ensifer sp.]|uniref:hypothetical protein n=1 Tax=Ensifer sp. TaxID=1872086 RepID=UPI0028A19816|nr:hypothetical protein [Ensifer sp.]
MASCKLGHIYIVPTVLTKPPKDKYAICVCVADGYFIWVNTEARQDGIDQLQIPAGCHRLIRHVSHVDLSRIVKHPDFELDNAKEFECISAHLAQGVIDRVQAGLDLLPAKHAELIIENLRKLL